MSKKKVSRQELFKEMTSSLGNFIADAFGEELETLSDLLPELVRPPGSTSESNFQNLCNRCGDCVKACKYLALQSVLSKNVFYHNTPALNLGFSYCRFCEDAPCIDACETGALSFDNYVEKSIGLAKIIMSNCIRKDNVDCKNCINKCEEIERAISLSDSKQNLNFPIVNAEKCSGCGACLTVCPADAIAMLSK